MLKDHIDLLTAFNDHQVRYLLVGGYALGRYTEPRATGDLDLFIEASPENAERVYAALAQFGAPLADYRPADFLNIYEGFQIGAQPQQVDLIFAISGLTFEQAWANSIAGSIDDGTIVRYLPSDALSANKQAVNRLQDQADVAAVLAARQANSKREEG